MVINRKVKANLQEVLVKEGILVPQLIIDQQIDQDLQEEGIQGLLPIDIIDKGQDLPDNIDKDKDHQEDGLDL